MRRSGAAPAMTSRKLLLDVTYAWPMNCRCSHDRKHLSEHVQISPSRGSPLKLKCPRWRTPAARIEFAPQSGHFADSASFSAAMKAAGLEVWSMKNSDV